MINSVRFFMLSAFASRLADGMAGEPLVSEDDPIAEHDPVREDDAV